MSNTKIYFIYKHNNNKLLLIIIIISIFIFRQKKKKKKKKMYVKLSRVLHELPTSFLNKETIFI